MKAFDLAIGCVCSLLIWKFTLYQAREFRAKWADNGDLEFTDILANVLVGFGFCCSLLVFVLVLFKYAA